MRVLTGVRKGLFAKSPFRREINLHVHRRAGLATLQARAQHGKHGSFFRLQSPDFFAQLFFDARLDFQREIAIEIRVQHFRMDVTLSADGSGVAEPGGDALDCGADVSFRLRCAIELLDFMERKRGQYRSGPGPEILGGDIPSGNFL
jgi:hypothetical protein